MSILLFLFIAVLVTAILIDKHISEFAVSKIFFDVKEIPSKNAALVPGTSKYTKGLKNLFYEYRLNAVTELWKNNKINAVVVSGDNSRKEYDEPSDMKNDLIERGIPEEYITLDYAGFRTLDSIVRANKIFGLNDYIIVSQKFHCERAIYLAFCNNQKVIGFCADDVGNLSGMKVRLREVMARTKAFIDLYLLNTDPKFLGKKEKVVFRK
jgi:SanA protein